MNKIIRIVSPAKAIEPSYIDFAQSFLEGHGFTVERGESVCNQNHYFAGSDAVRTQDFQAAIDADHVDVILCARGGYGSIRIIDQLDFSPLKSKPKLIIGFSDITVFHHHIHEHLEIPTVHATMPLNFQENTQESLDSLLNVLNGQANHYSIPTVDDNISGLAEGELIGGNLAIIYALIGTNSDINFEGKILFIEEVGEYIYAIDRMLFALKKSGKLSQLNGLIVGGMTNIKDTDPIFGKTIHQIILDSVAEYGYPVCFNFPAGHIEDNRALVFGRNTTLNISQFSVSVLN